MKRDELNCILNRMVELSKETSNQEEIPVVAALYCPGEETLFATNSVEANNHPFEHAEINVLNKGFEKYSTRYLKNCTLIVSLEPCLMCLGAILKAGIKDLYYVLDDEKLGALSYYHAFVDNQIRIHRIEDERFSSILHDFFLKLI